MTEVAGGIQPIPRALLQRFGIGKAAVGRGLSTLRSQIGTSL
jgi:hypothetical protein